MRYHRPLFIFRQTLCALCLFATALQALATDLLLLGGYQYNDDFEFALEAPGTPLPSGASPGGSIAFDGGLALGLGLELTPLPDPNRRVGIWTSHHSGTFSKSAGLGDRDMEVTHVHLTGASYYPQGNWEHFVQAGVGASQFSPKDSTLERDTRFSMSIGGGTQLAVGRNLLLRFEARWIPIFFNGSAAGICSGGCIIALQSDTYSQIQVNAGLVLRF